MNIIFNDQKDHVVVLNLNLFVCFVLLCVLRVVTKLLDDDFFFVVVIFFHHGIEMVKRTLSECSCGNDWEKAK